MILSILTYPFRVVLSALYYATFVMLLVIFHPIQVIAHRVLGYKAQNGVVNVLNFLIIQCFYILGATHKFKGFKKLPRHRTLIVISNHQSTVDIPAIVVGFRKHHVKFISKLELAKGLPSISYHLRASGSAVIDRKNGASAIKEVHRLGTLIEKNKWAACIFPEGTRSRTGNLRDFQVAGVKTLLKAAPSALVVPFCIQGHTDLQSGGNFPLRFGCKLRYTVLEPIDPAGLSAEEITAMAYEQIKKKLEEAHS